MYQRQDLGSDALIKNIKSSFSQIPEHRSNPTISLSDNLMSGFALFSTKSSSLLDFDKKRLDDPFIQNMKNLYGIDKVPCDSTMRETLDKVEPVALKPAFKEVFRALQRGKCLEQYSYLNNAYLIALDGTGYFSSKTVHCSQCLTKVSKATGETTYHHQMVGAVLIHPDNKVVLPLFPEPIIKQDGATKNDCERNAVRRWLGNFRTDHPKLKVIITEDGLSSNAPHIKDLISYNCSFILGAKPSDHKFLFEDVHLRSNEVTSFEEKALGIVHRYRFLNNVQLNASTDEKVNFIEYTEIKNGKVQNFTWVTDIEITQDNAKEIMRGGRARWKIENETFNTLKNQGYNFEHNFGHGHKNLSNILALLMFLAFAVDQVQLLTNQVFQALKQKCRTSYALWEQLRTFICGLAVIPNWASLFEALVVGVRVHIPDTT